MADDDWRITDRARGGGARDRPARAARRRPRRRGAGAREGARGAPARGLARRRDRSSSTRRLVADAEKAHAIVEAELRENGIQAQDEPDRALARRGGALGRRAAERDLGAGRARTRLRAVGGARRVRPTASRRASSPSSSRRRGTSPSAASSTSSSAPRAARTRTRWQPASTARSRWAARSSWRRRPPATSPSSAAWGCSRPTLTNPARRVCFRLRRSPRGNQSRARIS